MWCAEDHHAYDPICNTNASSVANYRITTKNVGA
jgi:hypothetical protein